MNGAALYTNGYIKRKPLLLPGGNPATPGVLETNHPDQDEGPLTPKEETRRRMELAECEADGIYFTRNYLKIVEPRAQNEADRLLTFDLWDFQVDYFQFIEKQYKNRKGVVAKKCRDMGITLTTLAWFFWHWRFEYRFSGLLGSLKLEEVKKTVGESDPLLSKIDNFLMHLPRWMWPAGFNYDQHSQSVVLTNPERKSSLVGSAMTKNFGISKRKSAILIDEDAQLENDVSGQCQQTSFTVIRVSTVNGHNHFEEGCKTAALNNELVEMPYHLNPNHTEEWLADQRRKLKPHELARFIFMDFAASVIGPVYPEFNSVPISEKYDYNPAHLLVTGWDFGLDMTVVLFVQCDPETREFTVIDEVARVGIRDIRFFVPFVPGSLPVKANPYRYTAEESETIKRHKEWKRSARHFGDISGDADHQNQVETPWKTLNDHRISLRLNDRYYRDMDMRTDITRAFLQRLRGVHPRCKNFIKSMQSYHYQDVKPGTATRDPKPIHDEHSHAATALEYICISENLIPKEEPPTPEQLAALDRQLEDNPWEFRY